MDDLRNPLKAGDVVRYLGASEDQLNWGNYDDPRMLSREERYTLAGVEEHSFHTNVQLEGVSGTFSSVLFDIAAVGGGIGDVMDVITAGQKVATAIDGFGIAAADAAEGITTVLEGTMRALGRCLWCGFVFCEHGDMTYYRVCLWPDDAPAQEA